jgi:hypothetical protein
MSFVASGRAVILNSRQSLYPCGADPWIGATARVIDDIAKKNLTLLASVGTPAWEIGLCLAGLKKLPIMLFVPATPGENENRILSHYCAEFRLDPDFVRVFEIIGGTSPGNQHPFPTARDNKIIEMADIIYPVSIRPQGNFDKLLSKPPMQNKVIDRTFAVPWQSRKINRLAPLSPEKLMPGLDDALRDYIMHWTRSVHYPWPGESKHDFYDALIHSTDNYPRSALFTLMRILGERRLRASSRHMRKGVSAVSFSSLPPSQAVALMRWRSRYREMSFEPYGIAIKKSAAEQAGIKKAVYGNREMISYLTADEKPYFQNIGTIGDWEQEREYRHLGDLDLCTFDGSEMYVITRSPSEIDKIKTVFDGRVLVLLDE